MMKRWICGNKERRKDHLMTIIKSNTFRTKKKGVDMLVWNEDDRKPVRATITVIIETEEKNGTV